MSNFLRKFITVSKMFQQKFGKAKNNLEFTNALITNARNMFTDIAVGLGGPADGSNIINAAPVCSEFFGLVTWANFGFNVFDIGEDLAASLSLSDAPMGGIVNAPWPFPAFVVRLPPGYIQTEEDKNMYHIFVNVYEQNNETWIRFSTTGEAGVSLYSDWPAKDYGSNFENDDITFTQDYKNDPHATKQDANTLRFIIRFATNVAHWLASTGGLKTLVPERFSKRLPKENRATIWTLGREVKISRELKNEAIRLATTPKTRASWNLHIKHWVRGHFKMQPFGEQSLERKRIWIMPYQRGLENTENTEPRTYRLEQQSEESKKCSRTSS